MHLRILLSCFLLSTFVPTAVFAACTNPTGEEADIVYNADYHVMQFCNGTNWISMAAGVAELKWNSDGTNVYYDGGNVGIGTNSPSSILHIKSSSAGAAIHLESGGTGSGQIAATGGDGHLNFLTSGATQMRILSDGNVGIGTTNAASKLHVYGTDTSTRLRVERNGASTWEFAPCGTSLCIVDDTGDDDDIRLVILDNGNVGIGTTSPLGPLHVALGALDVGSARFYAPLSDNQFSQIKLGYGDGSFQSAAIRFIRRSTGNEFSLFHWGEGGGIHLKQGGDVGIGTASPSYKLHVAGTAYATGAAGALSDRRHKKDIEALTEGALETILRLRPVTYQWKDPYDSGMEGKQLGFVAQEVEDILPQTVLTEDDEERTKGLKYNEFIPLLTKAIQELKADNDNLRTLVEEQGREISAQPATPACFEGNCEAASASEADETTPDCGAELRDAARQAEAMGDDPAALSGIVAVALDQAATCFDELRAHPKVSTIIFDADRGGSNE
jgi:hypothetical protein